MSIFKTCWIFLSGLSFANTGLTGQPTLGTGLPSLATSLGGTMGQPAVDATAMAIAQQNQQQLMQLASSPYGDSPLFRNLRHVIICILLHDLITWIDASDFFCLNGRYLLCTHSRLDYMSRYFLWYLFWNVFFSFVAWFYSYFVLLCRSQSVIPERLNHFSLGCNKTWRSSQTDKPCSSEGCSFQWNPTQSGHSPNGQDQTQAFADAHRQWKGRCN